METPALIDGSRDRATVVLPHSLQVVESAIVEGSLRDDVFHLLLVVFSRY